MNDMPNSQPDTDGIVDPDVLMAEVNKTSLLKTTLVSVLLHAVLLGVTSLTFISLCAEYNTLHPKDAIQAEAEQQRKEELKQKRLDRQAALAAGKAGRPDKSDKPGPNGEPKPGPTPPNTGGNSSIGKTPLPNDPSNPDDSVLRGLDDID